VSASKFIGSEVQTHLYKFINDTIRIAESSTGDNLRVYGGGLEVDGGAITASGEISASDGIYGSSIYTSTSYRLEDSGGTSRHIIRSQNNEIELGNSNFTDGILLTGNITASNDISSSGNLISDEVYTNVIRRQDDSSTTTKIKLDDEQIKFFANSSTNQTLQIEDGSVEVIGHITASGNISASGDVIATNVSASKYLTQIIPIVTHGAYYNGVGGLDELMIGNSSYGWADRVWNKVYTQADMVADFNSNANANCGVRVMHKLKNIKLVGSLKPSVSTGIGEMNFYMFKLPSFLGSSGAGNAPQPTFIASASSADTAGQQFRTVYMTSSAAGGHGGYNPDVVLEPGESIIVAANSSQTSGNIKFTYTVTGELDE
jgi:hypothetical protein